MARKKKDATKPAVSAPKHGESECGCSPADCSDDCCEDKE